MGIKRGLAVAAVAFAAVAGSVGTAQAAPAQQAAGDGARIMAPCGFFTQEDSNGYDWAMYNHCGSGQITIRVRYVGMFTSDRCVYPGVTNLQSTPGDGFISNAWWIADGCHA